MQESRPQGRRDCAPVAGEGERMKWIGGSKKMRRRLGRQRAKDERLDMLLEPSMTAAKAGLVSSFSLPVSGLPRAAPGSSGSCMPSVPSRMPCSVVLLRQPGPLHRVGCVLNNNDKGHPAATKEKKGGGSAHAQQSKTTQKRATPSAARTSIWVGVQKMGLLVRKEARLHLSSIVRGRVDRVCSTTSSPGERRALRRLATSERKRCHNRVLPVSPTWK